jgi:ferrous iron transport protein B
LHYDVCRFQAVFAWAAPFMDGIEEFFAWFGEWIGQFISQPLLNSLVVDGVIAGAGSVVVFLPQILILFFFILVLEESGYLPRAAFLLDKLMFKAGLSGRAFIPLLSSFACAVPGIMATRSISDPRDRLTHDIGCTTDDMLCTFTCICFVDCSIYSRKNGLGFLIYKVCAVWSIYGRYCQRIIVSFVLKFFQKINHNMLC